MRPLRVPGEDRKPEQPSTSSRTILRQRAIDMQQACDHLFCMSKMVQIRNVPDALHRRLKARAALEGKSLSDYLLAEIAESAERPTVGELRARLAGRSPVSPARKPALVLREERNFR